MGRVESYAAASQRSLYPSMREKLEGGKGEGGGVVQKTKRERKRNRNPTQRGREGGTEDRVASFRAIAGHRGGDGEEIRPWRFREVSIGGLSGD